MKDFINYYYNFYVTDIHLYNDKYFFVYNNSCYVFKSCEYIVSNIESIYSLTQQLVSKKTFYHQLIYNKEHSLVTIFQNRPYVMLKLSSSSKRAINIYDITGNEYVNFEKKIQLLNRFDWITLWENKIDYFEKQISSKKTEYNSILCSFNYFIGMAENAILYIRNALVNEKKESSDQLVVSHRRFIVGMDLVDFYDPTNLIVDHKSRDIAEFLKFSFINDEYDINIIYDYLTNVELSKLGAHLLFGRLLFPSFYFDYLELLLMEGNFDNIYLIEARLEEYNLFISEIFGILKSRYLIQEVNWITKKM